MTSRANYDDLSSFRTPTQRRNDVIVDAIRNDMQRIDAVLQSGGEAELKDLHIELDGTYQNHIKNWATSVWGYLKDHGFNYEFLGESSLRDNLTTMKGKLRGYLLELGYTVEESLPVRTPSSITSTVSDNSTEAVSGDMAVRSNMYDIIKNKKFDVVKEYERIWKLFNTGDLIGPRAVALSEQISASMQFFPNSFKSRALSLDDFDDIYGFRFGSPNESVTENELISYCEYIVTLCDHMWEYANDSLEDDSDYLRDDLFEIIESCMDELGLMPAKRDNITIFVSKDPAVTIVSDLVDESLSYDVKSYIHKQTKGDLQRKKTILKFLADDIEPQRKTLNSINNTFSGNLFQMLQKFVRHNNDDNAYIQSLNPVELESCYDDIYQMWLLAKMEIDNLDRKKRVNEILAKINVK